MSSKSRRRMTMAAGAVLAGACIPIAAAATVWADTEITYDGIVVYDNFPDGPAAGASDLGSAAVSGADNDWATYIGPAGDYTTAATLYGGATDGAWGANDASTGDANDVVTAVNSNTTQTVSTATIFDATGSSAYANDGGDSGIGNYGNSEGTVPSSTATMTGDTAYSDGSGSAAFVTNEAGTGTISGDGAYATDGAYAYVTDYGGTGNVEGDLANASGTNSFADVGNGYNSTYYSEGVDGGKEPVLFDDATATGGGTAIVGENQSDTLIPVSYDLASASHGALESLIDVLGHVAVTP